MQVKPGILSRNNHLRQLAGELAIEYVINWLEPIAQPLCAVDGKKFSRSGKMI